MSWQPIWILYRRELRSALRERSIVLNSILLPIFLYPVILWAVFSGLVLVQGLSEGFTSRVAIETLPPRHGALRDSLAAAEGLELRDTVRDAASMIEAVRNGEIDALVEIIPAEEDAGPVDNFSVRVVYDRSEDRSRRARDRVAAVIQRYRSQWLREEGARLGMSPEEMTQFRVEQVNMASGNQMGAFLLAQMLPIFLVIMVALGCFYPAIDSTAGERERSTWETLMTVSASRGSIVTAKYLYVATMGAAAGVLNVIALTASMGAVISPVLGEQAGGLQFSIPLLAVPVMAVGAVTLALFFAAAMMILASFARTFKDGQTMITPVYWLALVPLLVTSSPDQALDSTLALVPIANVTLMIREAITGVFQWPLIALTIGVELATVVICLFLARFTLQFEDLLIGSYDGSFWTFVRERLPGRRRGKEVVG